MARIQRIMWTIIAAVFAFVPGCFGGMYLDSRITPPGQIYPLPHHVPKSPDAVSFRFAMAHDVIHERFPKHGPAFYRERERLARAKLATLPPDSDEALALLDDIGAGLDRLGQPADAVPLLRKKLILQEKRGLSGRAVYTTYANLGTFLVHANMKAAMAGNADAKAAVKEGLGLVEKSIELNPNAHFGREHWQLVIGQFILEAIDRLDLLTQCDCIGNQFDREFTKEEFTREQGSRRASAYAVGGIYGVAYGVSQGRSSIRTVGGEWYGHLAPFDEPMLGIIGMWRQGGGANPHFALCIGEVMLRVGQRRIAWTAFERAHRLADRYWPDPAMQQFLREHCRKRQELIESTLPTVEVWELRPKYEAELAYGERYQREYQEFEAEKIAAGADIQDEHFFDDFHRGREPIASPSGPEEWIVIGNESPVWHFQVITSAGVFAAGLVALLVSIWLPRPSGRELRAVSE